MLAPLSESKRNGLSWFGDGALLGNALSPIGGGMGGRLVGAGVLVTLLWIAAAWAMGWLS